MPLTANLKGLLVRCILEPLIVSALMMTKRTFYPEAQIPFSGLSPYHFSSLVPVHPTGSIHGLTYLRLSSAERSPTSYSLCMVMEEVSCLKVIDSHI